MAAFQGGAAGLLWRPVVSSIQRRLSPSILPKKHCSTLTPYRSPSSWRPQSSSESKPKLIKVYGMHKGIRFGPKKLNLVAQQIRKLPIQNAIAQATFSPKKGGQFIKDVLTNTYEKAQRLYKCEGRKFYVAESYVGTGPILKHNVRYHSKGRFAREKNRFSHYFVVLREGTPPRKKRPAKAARKHFRELRITNTRPRSIANSL